MPPVSVTHLSLSLKKTFLSSSLIALQKTDLGQEFYTGASGNKQKTIITISPLGQKSLVGQKKKGQILKVKPKRSGQDSSTDPLTTACSV